MRFRINQTCSKIFWRIWPLPTKLRGFVIFCSIISVQYHFITASKLTNIMTSAVSNFGRNFTSVARSNYDPSYTKSLWRQVKSIRKYDLRLLLSARSFQVMGFGPLMRFFCAEGEEGWFLLFSSPVSSSSFLSPSLAPSPFLPLLLSPPFFTSSSVSFSSSPSFLPLLLSSLSLFSIPLLPFLFFFFSYTLRFGFVSLFSFHFLLFFLFIYFLHYSISHVDSLLFWTSDNVGAFFLKQTCDGSVLLARWSIHWAAILTAVRTIVGWTDASVVTFPVRTINLLISNYFIKASAAWSKRDQYATR